MSRYLPRVNTPLASGGGGGQTQDHQAPKIIVGSATNGDTAFVCDFLDPGDGSGIEAALASVGKRSTIWIRAGLYDLNAGSVSTPMVVPGGVAVIGGGTISTEIIGRSSGVASVFDLGTESELRNLGIISQANTAAVSGISIVRLGTAAKVVDCKISSNATVSTSLFMLAEMKGTGSAVIDSTIITSGSHKVACAGIFGQNTRVHGCRLLTDAVAINLAAEGVLIGNVVGTGGMFLSAFNASRVGISNVSWSVDNPIGVLPAGQACIKFLNSTMVTIIGVQLDNPLGLVDQGVHFGGFANMPDESRSLVSSCSMRNFGIGVFVDSNQKNDIVIGNTIQGATTPIDDNGVGTNAAQNVF